MKSITKRICAAGAVVVLASTIAAGGVSTAMAASLPFGSATATVVDTNLLTTYGVRAGSAGGDFMGISNTNFDFTASGATATYQYDLTNDYQTPTTKKLAGLAILGSSVNTNANPYYTNLLVHAITGKASGQSEATSWSGNGEESAWGDSFDIEITLADGTTSINGMEYSPDIIYGANKFVNWNLLSDGSNSETVFYEKAVETDENYNPVFSNNDSTNLWTQVYSMGQLAIAADKLTASTGKTTRYNSSTSTVSAVYYEKAIRGQLLYIASLLDAGKIEKKTVAYLYCIDEDGTAYFFVPTAEGLLTGDDMVEEEEAPNSTAATAGATYAANNSTINMGYMATLPYITNTFDSGNAVEGGIVMKVEDIYKANPACTVSASDTAALAGVDVIIFNTTTATSLNGTSGGKNSSGVGDTNTALTPSSVETWAAAHGFTGSQIIGGDDFGTSTNQTSDFVTCPVLYCQRNYTCDKDTRAAWGFAAVFPELYGGNAEATYGYWVNNVYHVKTSRVATVVSYMTNDVDVEYDASVAAMVEKYALIGYQWWIETGSADEEWSQYAYYNGSSRAAYYSGRTAALEPTDTIGIFQPSALWTAAVKGTVAQTMKLSKSSAKIKAGKSVTIKVTATGKVSAVAANAKAKKALKIKVSGKKVKITAKKTAKKGTYKVKIKAAKSGMYKAASKTIKIKVK